VQTALRQIADAIASREPEPLSGSRPASPDEPQPARRT
jgi:hypothetical protein